MSIGYRNEDERLIAEQAIAAFREAQKAMLGAPHGHGLAVTEEAVLSQGRKFLACMIQQLMSAHAEAQKGGPAAGGVSVEGLPRSSTTRAKS
jgi:hypothetical protein